MSILESKLANKLFHGIGVHILLLFSVIFIALYFWGRMSYTKVNVVASESLDSIGAPIYILQFEYKGKKQEVTSHSMGYRKNVGTTFIEYVRPSGSNGRGVYERFTVYKGDRLLIGAILSAGIWFILVIKNINNKIRERNYRKRTLS